jgi:peptidoglycan/LPS O-acetylase OafA/YrhL
MKTAQQRIPSLDGLRGLSICAVLLAHISGHFASISLQNRFVHVSLELLAYLGVTVFFVISGFLITLLLLKEQEKSGRIGLTRFYQRRAVRILPAFFLYTSVVLIVGHASFQQQLYTFTFTTSYFFEQAYRPLQQLWSLSVEEQFYLLWPLLLLLGKTTARRCCLATFLICPILRLVLKSAGYHQFGHMAPAILDSIAAGCLLAMYRSEIRTFARKYLLSTRAFFALGGGTILFAEAVYRASFVLLWGIVPCLIALVIAAAIERNDKALNHGPLAWSGLLSYSLYLWQQPFLVLDGPLNYLAIRLPLAFVAAYLSYRFVEQPIIRLFTQPARPVSEQHAGTSLAQET